MLNGVKLYPAKPVLNDNFAQFKTGILLPMRIILSHRIIAISRINPFLLTHFTNALFAQIGRSFFSVTTL